MKKEKFMNKREVIKHNIAINEIFKKDLHPGAKFDEFIKYYFENLKDTPLKNFEPVVLESLAENPQKVLLWAQVCKDADLDKCGEIILKSKNKKLCYNFAKAGYIKDIKPFENIIKKQDGLSSDIFYLVHFAHDVKGSNVEQLEKIALQLLDENPLAIFEYYGQIFCKDAYLVEYNQLSRKGKKNIINAVSDKNRTAFCTKLFLTAIKQSYHQGESFDDDRFQEILQINQKDLDFNLILQDLLRNNFYYTSSQIQKFLINTHQEKRVKSELINFPADSAAKIPYINLYQMLHNIKRKPGCKTKEFMNAVLSENEQIMDRYIKTFNPRGVSHYKISTKNFEQDKNKNARSYFRQCITELTKEPEVKKEDLACYIYNPWLNGADGGVLQGPFFCDPQCDKKVTKKSKSQTL